MEIYWELANRSKKPCSQDISQSLQSQNENMRIRLPEQIKRSAILNSSNNITLSNYTVPVIKWYNKKYSCNKTTMYTETSERCPTDRRFLRFPRTVTLPSPTYFFIRYRKITNQSDLQSLSYSGHTNIRRDNHVINFAIIGRSYGLSDVETDERKIAANREWEAIMAWTTVHILRICLNIMDINAIQPLHNLWTRSPRKNS
jgi:hypothetical protein